MKKGLVLVMALVLVVSFAFADQVGEASLGTDKGVVTAGDPVNVNFSFVVKDSAEDVTTIEVMGDEVADNVFVMLIKDKPNDAKYEARKVVDEDAKKTTYFIKAQELEGKEVKVYAELIDWENDPVPGMQKEATFVVEKNGTMKGEALQLTPPKEGLYTVKAYMEVDGSRMELKGFGGYAQLVSLDKYVKETVPGLRAQLEDGYGNPLVYGEANYLEVRAGMEGMYAKAKTDDNETTANATDMLYVGVYGEGTQSGPTLKWRYTENDKPQGEIVELVYKVNGDKDNGDAYDYAYGKDTDTAYIKFRVMQDSFDEGDCVTTCDTSNWTMWIAIGTGQFHEGGTPGFSQPFDFHVLGSKLSYASSWRVVKGAECRGWVKAIFNVNPSAFDLWLYAILGTDYSYEFNGNSEVYETGATDNTDPYMPYYTQNMVGNLELNLIAKLEKGNSKVEFGILDIPITKDPDRTTTKFFAAGDIKFGSAALGAQFFTTDIASITEVYDYSAYFEIGGIDVDFEKFGGFGLDAVNSMRVGGTIEGNQDEMLTGGSVFACFEADPACCNPPFKLGVDINLEDGEMSVESVFVENTHDLGTYGPVTLEGKLGAIVSLSESAPVDGGQYGKGKYAANDTYDWALGVGYEVKGSMTW